MKSYILLIPLLSLIVACDAPQRTRAPSTYITGYTNSGPTTGAPGSNPGTYPYVPTNPTTTAPTPTTTTPGFESCDLTHKYQTADVGWFGICQSKQDETLFKFRPSLTSTSVRTCLIPTYRDASGASTYIGNPQCTYTKSNVVVDGKLYKDRSGFSGYPINGVIVMREPLLPEYISCMHGYVNWPSNVCASGSNSSYCSHWRSMCPYGGRTGGACDTEARNYMANICNSFKTKYPNAYVDISVK